VADITNPISLFEVDRYVLPANDVIRHLSSNLDRHWDPADPTFLDLRQPFDVTSQWIMPREWFPELRSEIAHRLDEAAQIRLGNEIVRWLLSGILHGEQAAVYLSAQLCTMFRDPAEQEFAANQAREEARHVSAFTRYIHSRWGEPYPVGEAFGRFLCDLINSAESDRKLVGLSLLIEGFAMGAFSNIHAHTNDDPLKSMMRLLMRDEATHHNFGLWWLEQKVPAMADDQRQRLSAWAVRGFTALYLNLISIRQRKAVYDGFGLDWRRVRDSVREVRREQERMPGIEAVINPISVMASALDRVGLLTAYDRSQLERRLGFPSMA
jgi:rubrerythrin